MKGFGKVGKIVTLSIMIAVSAALIVGDAFAVKYAPVISGFFGTAEQIGGDDALIEQGAKNGDEVVRKLANEGVVLMKNGLNKSGKPTLPLPEETKKINIFGWGATDSGFLLSGNGSGRSYVHEDNKVTLLQAFKQSGFEYNDEVIKIYEKHCTTEDADWGETANWNNRYNTKLKEPVTADAFPADVINRAKAISDTALIVLSRYSGEYIGRLYSKQPKHDLPTDESRSFNEISAEEESLIKMCTDNFDNVIVLFNTGSIMDMSFVDDLGVDAAMNVGYMGQSGSTAIPKILKGEVNPSGRLADTVVYDPEINEITRVNGESANIVYAEDIYMGYKYYETADAERCFDGRTRGNKSGYDAVVQYPFGSGLSYTKFDWTIESTSLPNGSTLTKDSEIEINVRVTNKGERAGKDVVELYLTPPYIRGGVEKSEVVLLDFAKTPELKPEESTVVSFKIDPYAMASYDCYDKNDNGTTGWELDEGEYVLSLRTDSHNVKVPDVTEVTYKVDYYLRWQRDPDSNGRVRNRFTGETAEAGIPLDGSTLTNSKWKYLSRGNGFADIPTARSTVASSDNLTIAASSNYQYDLYDYDAMPKMGAENNLRLVVKEDGSYATKGEFDGTSGGKAKLKYNEELVKELGNPDNWKSSNWGLLLDQMTLAELESIVEDGGYGSRAIESIGKPVLLEYDGPSGFNRTNMSPNVPGSKFTALPAENLVGQTWNKELVYQAGQIVGIDGQNFGISGIYAPCVNLHREYLNGRNYECYSEDAVISGYLAANFIKGAKSNGVYSYLKHLALYDSGPYTDKRVWLTEQNFREMYLRPFEIAVKEGGATGMMISFNQIGPNWAGASAAMINGICRDEWGFKGTMVTDYDSGTDRFMNLTAGIRAGVNLQLNPQYGQAGSYGNLDMSDPVEVHLARESAKAIVYTYCNAYWYAKTNTDSNQYSWSISSPSAIEKGFDWWILLVVFINVAVFALLVWRALVMILPNLLKARVGKVKTESSDKVAAEVVSAPDRIKSAPRTKAAKAVGTTELSHWGKYEMLSAEARGLYEDVAMYSAKIDESRRRITSSGEEWLIGETVLVRLAIDNGNAVCEFPALTSIDELRLTGDSSVEKAKSLIGEVLTNLGR